MSNNTVIGRSFGSETVATKTEEGGWKVIVSMTEKRILSGSTDWEEKHISSMCTDDYFENAYKVATEATLLKFSDAIKLTQSDSLFEDMGEEESEKEEA